MKYLAQDEAQSSPPKGRPARVDTTDAIPQTNGQTNRRQAGKYSNRDVPHDVKKWNDGRMLHLSEK